MAQRRSGFARSNQWVRRQGFVHRAGVVRTGTMFGSGGHHGHGRIRRDPVDGRNGEALRLMRRSASTVDRSLPSQAVTWSVLDISVASAHRRTEAKRQRCGGNFAPGRRRGKTARPRALTMTAAADLIRATVHNRVDNWCAVHHWRITATADRTAPEPFCPLARVAARPVAPPQPHRRHFADRAATHRAGLGSATCSRREEREGRSSEASLGKLVFG